MTAAVCRSQAQIDKMLADAVKFAKEDEAHAKKISAKNTLESFAYSVKNQITDGDFKDKLNSSDRQVVEAAVDKAIRFVESKGDSASADELTAKKVELEKVVQPIFAKAQQGGAGGQGGEDQEDQAMGEKGDGPTVEEVD